MVNYKCLRCGYETTIKTILIRHLNRKRPCKPVLDDISNNDIISFYFGEKTRNLGPNGNEPKMSPIEPKMSQNHFQMSQNEPKFKCEFCEKFFKHIQSLNKHKKYRCKEKIKDDECKKNMMNLVNRLNDQIKEQREQLNEQLKEKDKQLKEQLREKDNQIKEKDKQINELIKKAGITQNIQNNIKILAYKNTDLSHLTDKDYMYCLNRSNMCIPHLIKRIHFNSKKPENHNVYISNIKNKYVMVYDGKKWNLRDRDETMDDLIDKNEFVLEQKLEEWMENGKEYPIIMKKFNRYLEKKEKNQVINKIKEEIKLVLFNNRKVIEI